MRSYTLLEQEMEKIAQINNIISLIYWDISANMPSGAAASRISTAKAKSSV
jgi:Zn-dependent M32 family carboxypeptidase